MNREFKVVRLYYGWSAHMMRSVVEMFPDSEFRLYPGLPPGYTDVNPDAIADAAPMTETELIARYARIAELCPEMITRVALYDGWSEHMIRSVAKWFPFADFQLYPGLPPDYIRVWLGATANANPDAIANAPTKKMKKLLKLPNPAPVADAKPARLARKQAAAAVSAAVRKQAAEDAAAAAAAARAAEAAGKRPFEQAAAPAAGDGPCITRIMATSQRTASGTTIFKGKGPHCYGEETLEYAWVKRNIKKWFLEEKVYPELDKWHKVPLGSAASDSASVAGGASGGGLLSMAVPFADGSVVDESLPLVPFVQGKKDICFSCSGANALQSAGDHDGAARVAAEKRNLAIGVVKNPLGPLAQFVEKGKLGWNCELDNAKNSWYPDAPTDAPRSGLMPYMIDNPYEGPTVAVLRDDKGAADHVVAISGSLIFDSNHSRALPLTCASFDLCVDMDHTGVKCDGIARAMRLVPTKKMKKLLKLPNSAPVADAKPASFDDLVSGISALSVV